MIRTNQAAHRSMRSSGRRTSSFVKRIVEVALGPLVETRQPSQEGLEGDPRARSGELWCPLVPSGDIATKGTVELAINAKFDPWLRLTPQHGRA